jgi:iron complex transport system substrate-binding protein
MGRARAHVVVALVALLVGVACSHEASRAPDVASRVVSLGPATTEALFAIGAGSRVVARSHYCDFPPEATKLPEVGGVEPDLEAILQLHPDLVTGPSGAWSTRFAQTLAGRGIATWFPDEIHTLAGVDGLLLTLGDRTGTRAGAERVVAALHAREQQVDRAVAGQPRPRVLMVVGVTPVVAAGPASFADDMLKHAGATNALADGAPWPVVSFEGIATLDPDVILDASVSESAGVTRITKDAAGWSGVRAVREGHVVPVADQRVLRPGPRVADGLAVVAHALHPDAVPAAVP